MVEEITQDNNYDLIIVGGGSAGLPAALYAARFNLKTLVITKEHGGLITTTHAVENWPGEISLSGFELAMKLENQVKNLGVPIKTTEVKSIQKLDDGTFKVETRKEELTSKAVVLATGSKRRRLDVKGEPEFYAKGVSYCATCDGAFFKDKVVGMVGGSDSAVKEALYLTEFATKVYIIYRRDYPRAEPINLKRMEEKIAEGKIEIINNANITEIKGENMLKSVDLDREFNGSNNLELDGLFVEIGADPNIELANQLGVDLNDRSEIIIDSESKTNVEAVYAAGDVCNAHFKQAITGAAEGVKAAFSAHEYLSKKE